MAGEADVREFLVTIFNAKICVQNIINVTFLRNGNTKKCYTLHYKHRNFLIDIT